MDALGYYYKNALLADLCGEYKGKWQAASHDKESLFRLAVCQQSFPHMATFAYKGDGLTKEYVSEEFKDFINGRYTAIDADGVDGGYKTQLFSDYHDNIYDCVDVLEVMWCNVSTIEIKKTKATKIYLACGSSANIVCDGYNSVIVMLFDDSSVTLEDVDENSSVTIYKYSDSAKVDIGKFCLSDKVREFKKDLRL